MATHSSIRCQEKCYRQRGPWGSPESDWTEGTERCTRTYTLLTTAVFRRGTWNNGECRKQCCIYDSVKQALKFPYYLTSVSPPFPTILLARCHNRCLINVDWTERTCFKIFLSLAPPLTGSLTQVIVLHCLRTLHDGTGTLSLPYIFKVLSSTSPQWGLYQDACLVFRICRCSPQVHLCWC